MMPFGLSSTALANAIGVTPARVNEIVRERRATFAALPAEDAKRPGPFTRWTNLMLAGDWTATGLPATIEGSIRSGDRASELVAIMSEP